MMKIRRMILLAAMAAAIALPGPAAYGQTVLTDIWKDKDHRAAAKKVAVFWIVRAPQNRLLAENEFVRQLKARGLNALPFYIIIEPDSFVERDAAISKIRNLGVEALLTLRVTNKQTVEATIPAPGTASPTQLASYYQYLFDEPVVDPGGPAYLETILFDIKTERRIWMARSVTKVDVIDQKALSDFIALMIDRLAADGMIP
jgi:hypothetical protein